MHQRGIAGGVAQGIVQLLEVIQVRVDQHPVTLVGAAHGTVQAPAVAQPRERIAAGRFLEVESLKGRRQARTGLRDGLQEFASHRRARQFPARPREHDGTDGEGATRDWQDDGAGASPTALGARPSQGIVRGHRTCVNPPGDPLEWTSRCGNGKQQAGIRAERDPHDLDPDRPHKCDGHLRVQEALQLMRQAQRNTLRRFMGPPLLARHAGQDRTVTGIVKESGEVPAHGIEPTLRRWCRQERCRDGLTVAEEDQHASLEEFCPALH